jgi:hypothetical protein
MMAPSESENNSGALYSVATSTPLYVCGGSAAERFEAAARADTDWEEGEHGLFAIPKGTKGAIYRRKGGLVMFKPSIVRLPIPTACLAHTVTKELVEACSERRVPTVSHQSLVLELAVPECFDLVGRDMSRYRCATCGSENVEHAVWVSLNSAVHGPAFGEWCSPDEENSWCKDCDNNARLLAPWEDADLELKWN